MISSQLREAVGRLAWSAADQVVYLERAGTAPSADELALEFSDALLIEREVLDEPVRSLAILLDRHLEQMSGPRAAALWTTEALHSAPEWALARDIATRILAAAGGIDA